MNLFSNPKKPSTDRLSRRVSKIPTEDLMAWVESSVYRIQRSLADWRRAAEPGSLIDAKDNAEALVAVLEECIRRQDLI